MIEIKINTGNFTNKTVKTVRRNFYKANYYKINSHLSSVNWEDILSTSHNCIDSMYSKFLEIVHKVIQQYVPMSKKRQKLCLPKEIKNILKTKRSLYLKSRSDHSLKTAYKQQDK